MPTTKAEGAVPDFLRMDQPVSSDPANAKKTGNWHGWPTKDMAPVTLCDDEGRTVRIRTPVMDLEGLITPTDLHYTVQHFDVPPVVETDTWQVQITGEVKRPLSLNFEQLRRFPARRQEEKFYSGGNLDYGIAVVIALPLSLIAAGLFTFILGGFGFFIILISLFVAPAVAGFIAEAVRWGVGRRRSRYLAHVVAACLILGTAPFLLIILFAGNFYSLLGPGIFVFLGTATVLARLR
jgi:hypothetical protein